VRTAGLPGMAYALGACFGQVVTMDSPHARPGEFQWEATLWHELAHVITLQMSNGRVPRWLTEGISVWEEKVHRPEWSRGMDMSFASMLNRKETLKLRDLNAAFTDAAPFRWRITKPRCSSSTSLRPTAKTGCTSLLLAFAKGQDIDAALKAALNTDLDQMQSGFDQTLEKMFGKLRVALQLEEGIDFRKMPADDVKKYAASHEGNYPAQLTLGEVLRKEGDIDGALKAFERAAALVRWRLATTAPNAQIAEIALQKKDTARAIKALQELETWDFDNPEVARQLAVLLKESGKPGSRHDSAIYQRIVQIDPFDADANAALGRAAMQMNQPADAVRAFRAVVALKPVDPAMAYTDLAESYFKSGNRTEARKQTLAALEIAPSLRARAGPAAEDRGEPPVRLPLTGEPDGSHYFRRAVIVMTLLLALVPVLQPSLDAQLPATGDERYAGLQWRFGGSSITSRRKAPAFRTSSTVIPGSSTGRRRSRICRGASRPRPRIDVRIRSSSPSTIRRLFTYPWIYFVEPGNLKLTDSDAKTLREFLLRGGTVTFDDFHGPFEWEHFAEQMNTGVSGS